MKSLTVINICIMNKEYKPPFVTVTRFTADTALLQYSGLNDMNNNPGAGWHEDLDDDFITLP